MNTFVLRLAEGEAPPEGEDVVAGWLGFSVWIALMVAVALLCWSMVRQLRKAQRAKDAGVYGDEPVPEDGADGAAREDEDDPSGDSAGAGTTNSQES